MVCGEFTRSLAPAASSGLLDPLYRLAQQQPEFNGWHIRNAPGERSGVAWANRPHAYETSNSTMRKKAREFEASAVYIATQRAEDGEFMRSEARDAGRRTHVLLQSDFRPPDQVVHDRSSTDGLLSAVFDLFALSLAWPPNIPLQSTTSSTFPHLAKCLRQGSFPRSAGRHSLPPSPPPPPANRACTNEKSDMWCRMHGASNHTRCLGSYFQGRCRLYCKMCVM